MANDGNLLTRPIGRALLALTIDLPYALEKPLMRRLLRTPVFEPATPTQLSAIAAFPSRDTAAGANSVPSVHVMMPATTAETPGGDVLEEPAFGNVGFVPSPAAARLSAVHSEL